MYNNVAETLRGRWRSAIYAFYKADVEIGYVENRRCLLFRCAARGCVAPPLRRYLDKKDRASSGNLFKHARACWGEDVVDQARELGDATRVRTTLVANILRNGTITEYFAPLKKGAASYSNKPLTRIQTRYVHIALRGRGQTDE